LSAQNGMTIGAFARTVLRAGIWNVDIDAFASSGMAAILKARAGVPAERVREMTLSSYESVVFERYNRTGLTAWIMPLGTSFRTRPRFGLQFCPDCLAEGTPYFRKEWRLAWCVVCTKHNRALLDRCVCGAPVRLYQNTLSELLPIGSNAGLELCYRCGFDLRRSYGVVHDLATMCAALDIQQRCLRAIRDGGIRVGRHSVPSILFFAGLRHLLHVLLSGGLSSVLRTIAARSVVGRSVAAFSGCEGNVERTTVEKRTLLMAIAARWICEWPAAFVSDCKEAGLGDGDICRGLKCAPFWLADVVGEHFGRRTHTSAMLETRGGTRYISKSTVVMMAATIRAPKRPNGEMGGNLVAVPSQLELPWAREQIVQWKAVGQPCKAGS
jgi:hypothetical protein